MFESLVTSGHDPAPSRRSLSSQRTPAGENRIRTVGPAEKETVVERGPAADHRRLARRPVLNDPSSLSVRHLSSATAETFHKSGTDRRYGAGGEDVATSSLHVTDGVPRCPSRTT